ncbi:MAG: hypothetical protein ACLPX9_16640 [Rhodomicrobium sp.]
MQKQQLRVLASRCHTATCCPTILECRDSGEIIIVGDALNALLASPAVKRKIGEGEAAVVIPRAVLIEALKSLGL